MLIDKAITGCAADDVAEIRSLAKTLQRWRAEILARHDTGASNGPTEGLNLCVKRVKRCGHGFRRFEHYRLRVLLHAGGVTWPSRPRPPRIRTCTPQFLSVLDAQPARRVFVRDVDQCWYQRGVRGVSTDAAGTTAALRALVDEAAPSRLVTLGTSAGGFGAIYFGCELGADLAIAFGPRPSPATGYADGTGTTAGHQRFAASTSSIERGPDFTYEGSRSMVAPSVRIS